MQLSEAEIQVLASIEKARVEATPSDQKSLESQADRFWVFAENWSKAYASLQSKGLIEGSDKGYRLTEAGMPIAHQYHRQRPDMYWYYYQKFYQAARASEAHSELCKRAFGADLCQEGQTDMAALHDLMAALGLKANEHAVDLGCGAGVIAEYIADETGASVTGIDYSEPAIAEAQERTIEKYPRLTFSQGDMNDLELPERSCDAVISLDTLYWAADLGETLTNLARSLRPGGRMGIFMNHHIGEGENRARLAPEQTQLSKALLSAGLSFETRDYTRAIGDFWLRNAKAATELRDKFEAEGNGFIAASLIREANDDYLPDVRAERISRYLYIVRP